MALAIKRLWDTPASHLSGPGFPTEAVCPALSVCISSAHLTAHPPWPQLLQARKTCSALTETFGPRVLCSWFTGKF